MGQFYTLVRRLLRSLDKHDYGLCHGITRKIELRSFIHFMSDWLCLSQCWVWEKLMGIMVVALHGNGVAFKKENVSTVSFVKVLSSSRADIMAHRGVQFLSVDYEAVWMFIYLCLITHESSSIVYWPQVINESWIIGRFLGSVFLTEQHTWTAIPLKVPVMRSWKMNC